MFHFFYFILKLYLAFRFGFNQWFDWFWIFCFDWYCFLAQLLVIIEHSNRRIFSVFVSKGNGYCCKQASLEMLRLMNLIMIDKQHSSLLTNNDDTKTTSIIRNNIVIILLFTNYSWFTNHEVLLPYLRNLLIRSNQRTDGAVRSYLNENTDKYWIFHMTCSEWN